MTDYTKLSDEDLATLVQKGESDPFGVLVERYEGKLLRYGKKFLATKEDIEDIVQDIFLSVYKNIQSFNVHQKFSPWIYRIAHNAFVNALKKKNRSLLINVDFDTDVFFPYPVAQENSESESINRMLKEQLDLCLNDLDIKYSEPLILYYFEELEYQEIAEVLRIPISTVGVRISRGKQLLKKIYQEKYGKPE